MDMFNFFEQPWTMLGIAVIVLFGILTYRSVVPEKRHAWQWLIPMLIAAIAFGTDALVKTDSEKIGDIIDTGIKAVETEDFNTMKAYISDEYRDSFHSSKEQLLEHVQRELPGNIIEKSKKTSSLITVSGNKAQVYLFMRITLNKDSEFSQLYNASFFQIKLDIDFIKQNNQWLINNIEISSVNLQPVRWNDIR